MVVLARDVSALCLSLNLSFRAKKKVTLVKLLEWIVVRPRCFFFFCGEGLVSSISADSSSMNQKLVALDKE